MLIKTIKKKVEISKSGNPFARVLIQLDEYRDGKGNLIWISGFGNKRTWLWKVGDDVQPDITQNGQYFNFSFDDTKENKLDIYSLPATVGFVLDMLKKQGGRPMSPSEVVETYGNKRPNNIGAANIEDIPFH